MANKPEKKKDNAKADKKKFSLVRYCKEVMGELKKLSWPTKKELVSYTLTVIAFVLAMAAIIGLLDLAFSQGLSLLTSL